MTALRARAAAELAERLLDLAPTLSADLAGLEVRFRRGWDRSQTLLEALERNAGSDAAQGFTQVGPHRADLRLMREGVGGGRGAYLEAK